MSSTNPPLVSLRDLHLTYEGPSPVNALRGVSLDVYPGELVVIEGPSGGGKSSLLNVIGLLQTPSHGRYVIRGMDTASISERDLTSLRSSTFSFIFQSFHVLAGRPARDSVVLAMEYAGVPTSEAIVRANNALAAVNLADAADQDASTLSGGQQQRVAIARALAMQTPVLIADEPTGNLDGENADQVLDHLSALRDAGIAVIVATHEPAVAERADRRIRLHDGQRVDADKGRRLRPLPLSTGKPGMPVPRRSPRSVGQVWRDASAAVWARQWRSFALVAAVSVAVGLAIGTVGLGTTAGAQVSAAFDARENRRVSVEMNNPEEPFAITTTGWADAAQEQRLEALRGVAGVEHVAILSSFGTRTVTGNPDNNPEVGSVRVGEGDVVEATESDIRWARNAEELSGRRALVGVHVAEGLALGPLDALPTVWIDGLAYPVVGIIDTSPRLPELSGSIVVLGEDADRVGEVMREQTLMLVTPGAAAQVARQAPLVVDPIEPEQLRVIAPQDPRDLREQIESSVGGSLAVLSFVALVGSVLTLANAMTLAVSSRRSELGLRRALGASPGSLFSLVITEASLLGVAGGAIGLALGYTAIFAVTISQRWTPVIEPILVPAALAGGVVVGVLAAMGAAYQASRVDPALALRM